jgi:hypothetical protein
MEREPTMLGGQVMLLLRIQRNPENDPVGVDL